MSYVVVNTLYLGNLARRIRDTEEALRGFSALAGSTLESSPVVRDGYNELSQRWDKRRGELSAALMQIALGLEMAAQSFDQTDGDLARAIGKE